MSEISNVTFIFESCVYVGYRVKMIVSCGLFDSVKQSTAIALYLDSVRRMASDESAGMLGQNLDALAYVASGFFQAPSRV